MFFGLLHTVTKLCSVPSSSVVANYHRVSGFIISKLPDSKICLLRSNSMVDEKAVRLPNMHIRSRRGELS